MPSAATMHARLAARLTLLVVATSLAACTDHGKASEEHATLAIAAVSKRATADVHDLELGFPAATSKLAALFAQAGVEPADDLGVVRKGLRDIRAQVPELARSNSTFFALTDAHGVALRNDQDQDVMAGQDLWKRFPDLRRTTDASFVTTAGLFAGAHTSGDGDRDWVAAAPFKDAHGAFAGMLLGGWTMRRLAYHLEEVFRADLATEQGKTKDPNQLPIVYISFFDDTGVYSAPATPEVNRQALVDLGLVPKTAGGIAHGVVSITDRDFGYAAVRVPALESGGGLVVLWSEV